MEGRILTVTKGIAPQDARQGRLWNFLNKGIDFYPIRYWPKWAIENLLAKGTEKHNEGRFGLFFFLVANGLSPELAGLYVLAEDVVVREDGVPHIVLTGHQKAHVHVAGMKRQAWENKLFLGRKQVLNMETQEIEWF